MTNTNRITRRTALALGLAATLAMPTHLRAAAPSGEPLRIAVLLALSGPAAAYGADERAAIEAVVQRANADGGINGRPIELIVRDTKTNPTEAARLANQVILDDKVIAIIGATTGSETLAFADLAMRSKVPVFPMVGTQSVTDPKEAFSKWMFRMSVPISTDLPASRDRIIADGHKRVAIFSEEDAYGQQASALFVSMAKEKGGLEVVENTSAPKAATDLTAQAIKIRRAQPDAIFLATSSTGSAGSFLRKLQEIGVNVPVYGMAGIVQKQIIKNGGKGAENLIAPALVNPDEPGPLTDLFDLLKDNGGVAGFGALLGANAAATVVQALKAGATDGPSLRDKVETMGAIKGYAAAPIQFSPTDHDSWGKDTLIFVTVRDGKFKNLGAK
ncbi:MAG: ABC transporter substrate-binding protein [Rhodopseudomonas palustris]|uniref:ABC transporter substrate-binding protein n=1 Tax=Rhodopseudomonas palustris TaxID=1076 RepID=A0A933RWG3_RHOPL|nr:ABC transporter substrate-binding protein [Rhodopseudomonas palustris]